MKTQSLPEWITALATAVQTIVISVTLIVAYFEWKGHEAAHEDEKVREVIRIYNDGLKDAANEASFVASVENLSSCHALRDRLDRAPAADPVHKDLQPVFDLSCSNTEEISESQIAEQAPHMVERLNKLALCLDMKQCDSQLSARLFCDDGVAFRYLIGRNGIVTGPAPFNWDAIRFISNCVKDNGWWVHYGNSDYDILTYQKMSNRK